VSGCSSSSGLAAISSIYFCDPESPWQRGSNDLHAGVESELDVLGHLDLSPCSQRELDAIARSLNTRPRQTLGWMTPSQAFANAVAITA
jgi:transposase, IS30 family